MLEELGIAGTNGVMLVAWLKMYVLQNAKQAATDFKNSAKRKIKQFIYTVLFLIIIAGVSFLYYLIQTDKLYGFLQNGEISFP